MMLVTCPHCTTSIEILAVNCGIFRCGVHKDTLVQLNPHLPQAACEALRQGSSIYGCGKPFRLVDGEAVACDYI